MKTARDDLQELSAKAFRGDSNHYYKDLEHLEDYFIKEPIINEQEYAEWEKHLTVA